MKKNELPDAVAQMKDLHLTGNVIPPMWFKTMIYRTKRGTYPHLLAINLLSDVCYWYRPREIRDERTGQIKRLEKKFKADKLQRDPKQISKQFGCSEAQAREAVSFLEARSLVDKEYQHSAGGRKNWQMFLKPNVFVLKAYTYPDAEQLQDFDFVIKDDREFVIEHQDCELANSLNSKDCELANSDQDCELATPKIANSQPSILTKNTLTQNNYLIPIDRNKKAARKRAASPADGLKKKKEEKPRSEIHVAIEVFEQERENWLRRKYGEDEVTEDLVKIEWSGKQIGMLKNLGTKLKAKARKAKYDYGGSEGYPENVLRVFLQKYAAMNEWFCDEFLPSHIVSHFDSIYRHAKAGKQQATSSNGATAYREALAKAVANL